jgi:hypothetical protein
MLRTVAATEAKGDKRRWKSDEHINLFIQVATVFEREESSCLHFKSLSDSLVSFLMKSYASPVKNKLVNESMNSATKGRSIRGNPGLVAAIERDDFDDLLLKNSEYINRIVAGQGDILDSATNMVDALGTKIQESSISASQLVDRLSDLDNLIDDEKRKWIVKVEIR